MSPLFTLRDVTTESLSFIQCYHGGDTVDENQEQSHTRDS